MRTDLPTASVGRSQTPTAAVEKSQSASHTEILTLPFEPLGRPPDPRRQQRDERIACENNPMPTSSQQFKRTVAAPAPSFASAMPPANRVFSVDLQADEDVEWITTSTADGMTYVSGYTITKRQPPGETPA